LQQDRRDPDAQRSKRLRIDPDNVFKIGHGGTLDPLATGVLVIAIGRGTKTLQSFLGGTKTYETVVLFGKSTDTYDIAGSIVADGPRKHVTKELVEKQMIQFRGKIKQVPPIYSALKIDGMKAYDYARTGKPMPRQLDSRDMTVDECVMLEWHTAGEHDFRWPVAEASTEDKAVAEKLMNIEGQHVEHATEVTAGISASQSVESSSKPVAETTQVKEKGKTNHPDRFRRNTLPPAETAALHTHDIPELSADRADGPAARIRLTSSSGFYVRSFAHDLGIACDSYGTMAELTRTRQSGYTIYSPVPEGQVACLTYEDLEAGEDVWGPKVSQVLEDWMLKNPPVTNANRPDDRDRRDRDRRPGRGRYQGSGAKSGGKRKFEDRRRNSSSPEP
jgi:tRNA pseudouridine55 synthase